MACYGTGGSDPSSAHSESTISYLTEKVPLPVNVILLLFIIPLCFFTLNLVCEELLVPTLNVLCGKLRLSNETANSTLLAVGASLPQFFSSIISLFITYTNIGIGLTIGSSFFNSLCILSAVLLNTRTGVVFIRDRIFLRDMFFYVTSLVLLLITLKGSFIGAFLDNPKEQQDDCLRINLTHTLLLLSSWVIYAIVRSHYKILVTWFCPSKYGEDGDDCDYRLPPMQMDDQSEDEFNSGNPPKPYSTTLSWNVFNLFNKSIPGSDDYAGQLKTNLIDTPVLSPTKSIGSADDEDFITANEFGEESTEIENFRRRERKLSRTSSNRCQGRDTSANMPRNPDDIVQDSPESYSCYVYKKNKFYSRFVGSHRAFDKKWLTCNKISCSFRYSRSHENPSFKLREFFIDGNEKVQIVDDVHCILKISHTMKAFKSMEIKAQNSKDFHKIYSILIQKIKDAATFSELNSRESSENVYTRTTRKISGSANEENTSRKKTPRLLRVPDDASDTKGVTYYLHGYILYPWKFLIHLTTIDIRMIRKKNMSPYGIQRKTSTSRYGVEMNSLSYAGEDEDEQEEIHEGSYSYALLISSLVLSTAWIFFICYSINVAGGVFANCIGVSSGVMGLTVVAFGTSIPNLVSAVNLSRQGLGGLVITNVISSSILSVFVGLSIPWLLIILIQNHGTPYDEMRDDGIVFAVVVLAALCIAFVILCVWHKFVLKRYMATFFIGCYCLYCAYGIFSRAIFNI